jgi:hypothetical protein
MMSSQRKQGKLIKREQVREKARQREKENQSIRTNHSSRMPHRNKSNGNGKATQNASKSAAPVQVKEKRDRSSFRQMDHLLAVMSGLHGVSGIARAQGYTTSTSLLFLISSKSVQKPSHTPRTARVACL